jgi:hypothetical protein
MIKVSNNKTGMLLFTSEFARYSNDIRGLKFMNASGVNIATLSNGKLKYISSIDGESYSVDDNDVKLEAVHGS